jgi:PAS domain S-box-containing protein
MKRAGRSFYVYMHKSHNEALQVMERRYGELIEQVYDYAIFFVDPEGRPTTWNQGVKRVLGFDEADFINADIDCTIFTPEDQERHIPEKERQEAVKNGSASDDRWLLRKNGERFWASGITTALRDESGTLIGFSKVFRDQTEAKKAIEALHQSEERLRLILESGTEYAIVITDPGGRIVVWSSGAANIFGYSAKEIEGKPAMILFTPEDQRVGYPAREMETALRERRCINERWQIRKSGERFWASGVMHSLWDGDGRPKGFLKIVRDWTEQRLAAEKLERTVDERTVKLRETVEDLEAFSYSIAHDLRSPLRAMQGFAALLREQLGTDLPPEAADYAQRISAAASRLDHLIQDILNYSRMVRAELPLGPLSPESLLREIIDTYPNLQTKKATIQIEPGMPHVIANKAALTQVFSNILGNAVKFVAPGVHPQIAIWGEPSSLDSVASVKLFFKDNGIGIPAEHQVRLFDMFQRLHPRDQYDGTGIGLAIVRKAVHRMGGKVGVFSEIGKGSTFWVELPKAER